jgi:hypothetical protein
MRHTPTQPPRSFVPLGQGPWLRQHPIVQRVCGVLCLGALGVMVVVACVLGQKVSPVYHGNYTLVWLLLGAGALAFFSLWGFVACRDHDSNHQYCPECLQFMRRGARVCPFCGFREEQTPTATPAATPLHQPRRSA